MSSIPVDPTTALENSTYEKPGRAEQDLDSVDFMNLIVTQMQNQNPLDPQDNDDFMAQLAQFESLSQNKKLAESMDVMQGLNELSSASALIGKEVVGEQVEAVGVVRDMVSRDTYGTSFDKLSTAQQREVNNHDDVIAAAQDAENEGEEVQGTVDRVVVGPDGIPMLFVGGKVVDLFTVSQVQNAGTGAPGSGSATAGTTTAPAAGSDASASTSPGDEDAAATLSGDAESGANQAQTAASGTPSVQELLSQLGSAEAQDLLSRLGQGGQ